jgi:hypothetical protein
MFRFGCPDLGAFGVEGRRSVVIWYGCQGFSLGALLAVGTKASSRTQEYLTTLRKTVKWMHSTMLFSYSPNAWGTPVTTFSVWAAAIHKRLVTGVTRDSAMSGLVGSELRVSTALGLYPF